MVDQPRNSIKAFLTMQEKTARRVEILCILGDLNYSVQIPSLEEEEEKKSIALCRYFT